VFSCLGPPPQGREHPPPDALALFDSKGNVVSAALARATVQELESAVVS
jgi:hypothetical protein